MIRGAGTLVACRYGRLEVVRLLLDKGADVQIPNSRLSTPLITAACFGHIEVVRCLLAHGGSDLHARTLHRASCLLMSAYRGYVGIVRLLLLGGADPYLECDDGTTAFYWTDGRPQTAQLLDVSASPE
jgi:ankyrin repeat protein